jgi:hypothetical protein
MSMRMTRKKTALIVGTVAALMPGGTGAAIAGLSASADLELQHAMRLVGERSIQRWVRVPKLVPGASLAT